MLQRHQFEAQGNGNLQMRQKYCLKVYFFTYSSTGLIYISFINHGTHPRLKVEHLDQRELNASKSMHKVSQSKLLLDRDSSMLK